MTDVRRRLVALRHATAVRGLGQPDIERPLTAGGRAEARAAGKQLVAEGIVPDHAVCSPAARTRETLDVVRAQLPEQPSVSYEPSAYNAPVEQLHSLVAATGPAVDSLLLVAHNPGIAELVDELTRTDFYDCPPATLAVVEFDGDWADISAETRHLRLLWTP
ncbi:SixA phosphatase family protein [Allonocardiopsis opalescens]|uniref:Phosphohistidine phosphatase n=1 Tax=Allonocardiopsis opalescens TaxID=1144618 RepID=A0A2T0Q6N9_9ACTN|nr:histidine phosphatase family protein [Allonocardiopsis opalescens]PRX99462.1 phosphohistidine phosphatase [Allonocardiopsis opalescens]